MNQPILMDTIRVLCQDCLRVFDADRDAYLSIEGQAMCVCGGEIYHCEMCMEVAAALKAWMLARQPGVFDGSGLMVQVQISSWSEDSGAVVYAPKPVGAI